jgi:hypothetical protein
MDPELVALDRWVRRRRVRRCPLQGEDLMEPIIETTEQLAAALQRITFVNTVLDFKWRFESTPITVRLGSHTDGPGLAPPPGPNEQSRNGWLLWVSFERPDTLTGNVGRGRGREEVVWQGATLSGVIKTAWLLVELMVRHELMEGFRFDDARIFNPHNSVLDLARVQEIHDRRIK